MLFLPTTRSIAGGKFKQISLIDVDNTDQGNKLRNQLKSKNSEIEHVDRGSVSHATPAMQINT